MTSAHLEAVGDRVVVIRAHGEFDLATSRTLSSALEDAAGSDRDIVLDLGSATFLDVYCLRLVLTTQSRLSAAGRTVVVTNAPPVVQRLVDVLHIPDLVAS
jgi:anti-anti-sigma factor